MSENDITEPVPAEQDQSPEHIHERAPLPPPTFEFLVMSIATQAQMQLGLFHFGDPKEAPEPDLEMAKHSIDLLGIIQEKTKGNLALEEERLLNNSLTELRFRFVQARK